MYDKWKRAAFCLLGWNPTYLSLAGGNLVPPIHGSLKASLEMQFEKKWNRYTTLTNWYIFDPEMFSSRCGNCSIFRKCCNQKDFNLPLITKIWWKKISTGNDLLLSLANRTIVGNFYALWLTSCCYYSMHLPSVLTLSQTPIPGFYTLTI